MAAFPVAHAGKLSKVTGKTKNKSTVKKFGKASKKPAKKIVGKKVSTKKMPFLKGKKRSSK